jgi:hypothetical protein
LTLGGTKHTDNDFITVLLQDHIGGLQVLYENTWVDVSPVPGALVINIGDLLQVNFIKIIFYALSQYKKFYIVKLITNSIIFMTFKINMIKVKCL